MGYNYRLSNILAALGRAQLARLDDMMKRRREWRERYRALFADQPGVRILGGADDSEDNCWLTALVVDPASSSWTAQSLGVAMDAAGVETRPVWKPMHLQPVHARRRAAVTGTSERLFDTGVTLPSGSELDDGQVDRVVDEVRQALGAT